MRTFLKIVGWLLSAPVAFIAGLCLLQLAPIVYEVEVIPLENLPPHALTVKRVSDLNERLRACTSGIWEVGPLMACFDKETMLAVATEEGGLQLVHVYPALAWRAYSPENDWRTVVQQWLACCEQEERRGR